MTITRQNIETFENIKTADQFMSILRSYKLNQQTESTTIMQIEFLDEENDFPVADNMVDIYEEDYGTVLRFQDQYGTDRAYPFPIQTIRIETRTTMKF